MISKEPMGCVRHAVRRRRSSEIDRLTRWWWVAAIGQEGCFVVVVASDERKMPNPDWPLASMLPTLLADDDTDDDADEAVAAAIA